ncbi:MAG TPA: hypothetical protein VFP98_03525, partial [Candidatus Polarisedimenticolia bacterium]|nr:hypothetical protein [Candidatus Polarisedimenticolia bacterium]
RQAARVVPQAARDGDLVYAVGTDRSTYYRIYLAGRPVKVLAINVKPARDAGRRSAPETFTSTFIDVLEEEVRAVESLGGRCLIDHWILEGKISTSRLTSGLDRAEFNELLKSRFRIVPIATQPEGQFYELRAGHPDE